MQHFIERLNDEFKKNPENAQRALEQIGSYSGQLSLKRSLEKASSNNYLTDICKAEPLISKYTLLLSNKLQEKISKPYKGERHKKSLALLDHCNLTFISLVCIKSTLNFLIQYTAKNDAQDNLIQKARLSNYISDVVLNEIIAEDLNASDSKLFTMLQNNALLLHKTNTGKYIEKKHTKSEIRSWKELEKKRLGNYIINVMKEIGFIGIFMCRVHSGYTVNLSDTLLSLMQNLIDKKINCATYTLPMIINPQPWMEYTRDNNEIHQIGGYIGNLKCSVPFALNAKPYAYPENKVIYPILNYLQNIPWKINTKVLQVYKKINSNPILLDRLMQTEYSSIERPIFDSKDSLSEVQKKQWAEYKETLDNIHALKCKNLSKRALFNTSIEHAELLSDKPLYFVYQYDFRGRIYAVSSSINPQGHSIQRSLLLSHEGCALSDTRTIQWFKFNIAKIFGGIKNDFSNGVKWVDDNHADLLKCAVDPLDSDAFKWWTSAAKPGEFLALVFEYAEFIQNPQTFKSHIGIALDGTCNGLQHYSALYRDELGAKYTNLSSSRNYFDFYTHIRDKVIDSINKSNDQSIFRGIWLNSEISRELIKKIVIARSYGASKHTCQHFITSYCLKTHGLSNVNINRASTYLSEKIWVVSNEILVPCFGGTSLLAKVGDYILNNLEKTDIEWKLPSGFICRQVYRCHGIVKVQSYSGYTCKHNGFHNPKLPDIRKHKIAIAPNFIQSLDACHLHYAIKTIDEMWGYKVFICTIHDSYAMLPDKIEQLFNILRKTFHDLHVKDLENTFRVFYPDVPKFIYHGTFDIKETSNSNYIFI